jgi:hypothetical protein
MKDWNIEVFEVGRAVALWLRHALHAGRSWVQDPMRWMIYMSLPNAYSCIWPWDLPNIHQKWVPERERKKERRLCAVEHSQLPFMNWLCRQCGIFNIPHTCRPPWPVLGIALFMHFCTYCMFSQCEVWLKVLCLTLGILRFYLGRTVNMASWPLFCCFR